MQTCAQMIAAARGNTKKKGDKATHLDVEGLRGDCHCGCTVLGAIPGAPGTLQGNSCTREAGAECPALPFPPLLRASAELVQSLVAAPTKKERMKLPGMTEKREDVITAGAVLLLELFDALGIKEMMVRRIPLAASMKPVLPTCPP